VLVKTTKLLPVIAWHNGTSALVSIRQKRRRTDPDLEAGDGEE